MPARPFPVPTGPALQRTSGVLRLGFTGGAQGSRIHELYQEGAARARLPRVPVGTPPEAVLINTAGGLTGGDRMSTTVRVSSGARATVTTQASEKVYRASAGDTCITNRIVVEDSGRLEWLPQETILFDRARLDRTLEVDVDPDGRVLLAEAIVFGRTAMGESVRTGILRDRWRVRRGGRLVFADGLVVRGEREGAAAAALGGPTALDGGCAAATVLLVAPDAESRLGPVRDRLHACIRDETGGGQAGASAWDGMLVTRIVAPEGAALRRILVPLLEALRDGRPLPTVWHC